MYGKWHEGEEGDTPDAAYRRGVRDALYLSLSWDVARGLAKKVRPPLYITVGMIGVREAYTVGLKHGTKGEINL